MALFVVRHACAGDKRQWPGRDDERPLDEAGVGQARALVDMLGATPIRRILSSPAVRCRRSVEPLARRLGLDVEPHEGLRRDATLREMHDLLAALHTDGTDAHGDVVLCTHGELMRPLLAELREDGVSVSARDEDDGALLAKGTAWRVTLDAAGAVATVEHLVPAGLPLCPSHAWS